MNIVTIWLLAGAILVAIEVFTVPGLGLFLAGLGAMSTGIVIRLGIVDTGNTAAQFCWFFALTTVWTASLWRMFRKFRLSLHTKGRKEGTEIIGLVGSQAIINEPGLKRGETGQVRWSGTLMSAVLHEKTQEDFLPAGSSVLIESVSGTLLTVSPIHSN